MTLLILGAAGKISRRLIPILLNETDHDLLLYARNTEERLWEFKGKRVKLIFAVFLTQRR